MQEQNKAGAWNIIRAYWVSEDRWLARGLLALVVGMDLLVVWRAARITFWQKDFYDALAQLNAAAFWGLLGQLAVLASIGIVLDAARTYTAQALEMRWRAWMTDTFLARWLSGHAYYRLERRNGLENVDQRIAEDLRLLASHVLELGLGLLSNVVNLVTFATIVWGLSGVLTIALAGHAVAVPGYMLGVAVLYAVIGSVVMEKIGGRLVAIDYQQQCAEADFRVLLVRVREHAEQIAFYDGQQAEQARLRHHFAAIRQNWREIMTYTKRITATDRAYTEIGALVPYMLQGPRVFQGLITLGDLVQLTQSFMKVRVALSWFIYKYKALALLRSVLRRLVEFDHALHEAGESQRQGASIARRTHAQPGIALYGVQAALPDGRPLTRPVDWRIQPGEHWLLRGPSGAGKSTLLRALAGLWTDGHGRIDWPRDARAMFVPQQSYLPIATLRDCLCYPDGAGVFSDAACRQALRWARLEHLAARLDEQDHWARRLSPGEQQRLAFARVWLQQPRILFLDEATASLDEDTEALLYGQLVRELPGLTLVSVAHRSSVRRFHTHVLDIAPLVQ